jgi:hypothetical protein
MGGLFGIDCLVCWQIRFARLVANWVVLRFVGSLPPGVANEGIITA